MKPGQLFLAVCTVAIVVPWLLTSLQRNYINLNGITLTLVEVIQETITRQRVDWSAPQTQPESQPRPQQPQGDRAL